MKVILEFSLPDGDYECKAAMQGHLWRAVVEDFDAKNLRGRIKYQRMPARTRAILDQLRDELYAVMREHGVNLCD